MKPSVSPYLLTTGTFFFSTICFFLFYLQGEGIPNAYFADLTYHVQFALDYGSSEGSYSLFHLVIIGIAKVMSLSKADDQSLYTGIAIIILVAAKVATLLIIHSYLGKRYPAANPLLILFLAFSLMFVSMIILNPLSRPLYVGTGSPNIWHNPTFIFAKPFALIAFISLVESYEKFKQDAGYFKGLIGLSLFAALGMWAKPSFLISFLPAVGIVFFLKLLQKDISPKYFILLVLALLPSLIPLIMINNTVYAEQTSSRVIFTVGEVWLHYTKNLPLSIAFGMAFPLFVVFGRLKRWSVAKLLAVANYMVATLVFFFLAESGTRMYHANFAWTYSFAMFFMFLVCAEDVFLSKKFPVKLMNVGWGLFLLHLLSGLLYLAIILTGFSYM